MVQEIKYYTPDLEDLHIGYVCDHTSTMGALKIEHEDRIAYNDALDAYDLQNYIKWISEGEGDVSLYIRTPYLSKEQIESERWAYIPNNSDSGASRIFRHTRDSELNMWWNYSDPSYLQIINVKTHESWDFYNIKSINEFRKLMKFLNL